MNNEMNYKQKDYMIAAGLFVAIIVLILLLN